MKKIIAILLCLLLTLSFVACDVQKVVLEDDETGGELSSVEISSARESLNPLTGEMDLANDRVGFRPVAVSVNNRVDGWPQRGTSLADVIIELETEGGITRFMCMFSDYRLIDEIGSVRSLRDPFMEFLYPLDAIIVHIGTSKLAEKAMAENNYRTIDADIDENNYVKAFDSVRAASFIPEHCWFTSSGQIEKAIENLSMRTESNSVVDSLFKFSAEAVTPADGAATSVSYDFNTLTDSYLSYNTEDGLYYKSQYANASYPDGRPQMDENSGTQLCFKNAFVLYCNMSFIGEPRVGSSLAQIDYSAGGTGYYFSNGAYQTVTWEKGSFESPLKVLDADGNEISVNPGKSYISIVDKEFADTMVIA